MYTHPPNFRLHKSVTKQVRKKIVDWNKKIYDSISKIGKNISKTAPFDKHLIGEEIDYIDIGKIDNKHIDQVISKHLFVSGRFDTGEQFCQESGVHLDEEFKSNFRALDSILTEIDNKKLDKVFEWIAENESKLKISDSDVPFLAHKVKFCQMLVKAKKLTEGEEQTEVLSQLVEYSKENFQQFFPKYQGQVSKLLTSLAFINEIEDTKYQDLVNEIHWNHLTQNFVKDFWKIQGSGKDSGLTQQGKYFALENRTLHVH